MPSVLLVLGLGLTALSAGADQVRCVDAARATARLAARGEPPPEAIAAGRRLAPRGADIRITPRGGEVSVVVTAPAVAGLQWVGLVLRPTADAVATREDSLMAGVP
jgi:hypothetical protein